MCSSILLFVLISVSLCAASPASDECFRASVVEQILIGAEDVVDNENPLKNVRKNLQAFREAAERAKGEHSQIIVFPEEGLFTAQLSSNPNLTLRQSVRLLAEDIPDPRYVSVNPCTEQQEFQDREILQTLSCIARDNQIYLVADVADVKNCKTENCTTDGILMYNTQIAFDRQGNLIARYHKYHLYGEFHFNVPNEMEFVYFDTDFGARIGMYICFDRLFRDPLITLIEKYNVTTMALSTWFFDEYPFLMSHQIDQAWSIGLNINILSSNSKYLSTGSTGSGIFSPKYVAGYTHDTSSCGKTVYPIQIVGTVPVNPASRHKCDADPWLVRQSKYAQKPGQKYRTYYGDWNEIATRQLNEPEGREDVVCDGELCCFFAYRIKDKNKFHRWSNKSDDHKTFYLGAKSRLRKGYFVSSYTYYEQACFIISYNNDTDAYETHTETVFDELQITGNFSTKYRYPSALGNDFKLIKNKDLHFSGDTLSVTYKKPLIYAGIYARVYERDPPYAQSGYGSGRTGGNPVNGFNSLAEIVESLPH